MRFLLILITLALAACGGSVEESAEKDVMHTAADGLQQEIEQNMEKASAVEEQLQQAVDELDAAVDQASGEN